MVEFRRVPGLADEEHEQMLDFWDREPVWRYLGLYPLLGFMAVYFGMIGIV